MLGSDSDTELLTYNVERILHLVEGMETRYLNELGRRMFFDIEWPGDRPIAEARYGMSESYYQDLKRAGEDGVKVLAQRIAKDVARILLGHKKEEGGPADG